MQLEYVKNVTQTFFVQDMVDQVLRHTLGHDVVTNSLGYIGSTHLLYTIPSLLCMHTSHITRLYHFHAMHRE